LRENKKDEAEWRQNVTSKDLQREGKQSSDKPMSKEKHFRMGKKKYSSKPKGGGTGRSGQSTDIKRK